MSLFETGLDLDAGIVYWEVPSEDFLYTVYYFFATVTSSLCGATVIYALCRDKNIPLDSQFIISLSLGDTLLSLVTLVVLLSTVTSKGYAIGNVGCMLHTGLCIIFAGCSIVSISMLAAYRYLVGIRNYHPTQKEVSIAIGCVWIITTCAVASFVPFWKRVVALQSGNGYCFIAFWSRDPVAMTASLAVLFVLVSSFSWMIFVYTTIAWRYSAYHAKK